MRRARLPLTGTGMVVSAAALAVAGLGLAALLRTSPSPSSSPSPPSSSSSSPSSSPSSSSGPAALPEPALMARLRAAAASNPALTVLLARDGNQRFPDSAGVPERTALLVRALTAMGWIAEARAEAARMASRYPGSPWTREVEPLTAVRAAGAAGVPDAGARAATGAGSRTPDYQ